MLIIFKQPRNALVQMQLGRCRRAPIHRITNRPGWTVLATALAAVAAATLAAAVTSTTPSVRIRVRLPTTPTMLATRAAHTTIACTTAAATAAAASAARDVGRARKLKVVGIVIVTPGRSSSFTAAGRGRRGAGRGSGEAVVLRRGFAPFRPPPLLLALVMLLRHGKEPEKLEREVVVVVVGRAVIQ